MIYKIFAYYLQKLKTNIDSHFSLKIVD